MKGKRSKEGVAQATKHTEFLVVRRMLKQFFIGRQVIENGGRQPVYGIHCSEKGFNPVFVGKMRVNKEGEASFKNVP